MKLSLKSKTTNINLQSVIIVFLLLCIAVLLLILVVKSCNSEPSSDSAVVSQTKWPKNRHTQDLPELSGDIYKVTVTENSTAVFYKNVTKEQLTDYKVLLNSKGFFFSGSEYPQFLQKEDFTYSLGFDKDSELFSITIIHSKKDGA